MLVTVYILDKQLLSSKEATKGKDGEEEKKEGASKKKKKNPLLEYKQHLKTLGSSIEAL